MENEFHVVGTDIQASIEVAEKPPAEPVFDLETIKGEDLSIVLQKENETRLSYDEITEESIKEVGDQPEPSPNSKDVLSPKEITMPENFMLEEGFATMEAQLAYYEFVEAAGRVDSETGEEAEIFFKALDTLNEHLGELSLPKLFSVLGILLQLLIVFWANRAMSSFSKKRNNDILNC